MNNLLYLHSFEIRLSRGCNTKINNKFTNLAILPNETYLIKVLKLQNRKNIIQMVDFTKIKLLQMAIFFLLNVNQINPSPKPSILFICFYPQLYLHHYVCSA